MEDTHTMTCIYTHIRMHDLHVFTGGGKKNVMLEPLIDYVQIDTMTCDYASLPSPVRTSTHICEFRGVCTHP